MMYADDNQNTFPPSTDYSVPVALPERIWTMKILLYVQNSAVFACPSAKNSMFPSNWTDRGVGSIGFTTATAYDPQSVEGFPAFTQVSIIDQPSLAPLFGDTASGPTADKYRGYCFDPYNGTPNPVDARFGTPLISERDLVQELNSLPASALKPLHARHAGGVTLIFADGHASSYSATSILPQDKGAALHWRFRPQLPPP
jgi:prepilin-type processing-associated H-X9-DG protein